MTIEVAKFVDDIAHAFAASPGVHRVMTNPLYTALLIISILMIMILIAFRNAELDEGLWMKTLRIGAWGLLVIVGIQFLRDHISDDNCKKQLIQQQVADAHILNPNLYPELTVRSPDYTQSPNNQHAYPMASSQSAQQYSPLHPQSPLQPLSQPPSPLHPSSLPQSSSPQSPQQQFVLLPVSPMSPGASPAQSMYSGAPPPPPPSMY